MAVAVSADLDSLQLFLGSNLRLVVSVAATGCRSVTPKARDRGSPGAGTKDHRAPVRLRRRQAVDLDAIGGELDVTRERVRQLVTQALKRIEHSLAA